MMLYTVIVILLILLSLSVYVIRNLLSKIEVYEKSIEEFYSSLSITLHMMRMLDQKQMFENDDEVGEIFSQLRDILFELRPLLYGKEPDDEKD